MSDLDVRYLELVLRRQGKDVIVLPTALVSSLRLGVEGYVRMLTWEPPNRWTQHELSVARAALKELETHVGP